MQDLPVNTPAATRKLKLLSLWCRSSSDIPYQGFQKSLVIRHSMFCPLIPLASPRQASTTWWNRESCDSCLSIYLQWLCLEKAYQVKQNGGTLFMSSLSTYWCRWSEHSWDLSASVWVLKGSWIVKTEMCISEVYPTLDNNWTETFIIPKI